MKKNFTLLLPFLCFISTNVLKGADASITFSNPSVVKHLSIVETVNTANETYTVQTSIGGKDCRNIPGSKYGYFKVDDATISSSQSNLIFTITYFDSGSDNLNFQYNSTLSSYTGMTIRKNNSNTWTTATLAITNASLKNAQNNGADFRIGTSGGGNNYISEITISFGKMDPNIEKFPITKGSSYSEFKNKSVCGYQAWFATGKPSSGWVHWAPGAQPAVGHVTVDIYPDVTGYADQTLATTGFANLGSGEPSKLFNSSDTSTISTHFKWLKKNGIDGFALQRFSSSINTMIHTAPNSMAIKQKNAAEANGRIFYVSYDISGPKTDTTWDDNLKFDWVYNIEQNYKLTASPSYATVNNRPVVEIWGAGFSSRPGTAQEVIDLINFFHARGCYVIGGVSTGWRTVTGDSRPDFLEAYKAFDMISPWSVGRYQSPTSAINYKNNVIVPDKTFCDENNIDYLPVVFPGFSWSVWAQGRPNAIPRKAGDFLWTQMSSMKTAGINGVFFAMLDEYDEGTALLNMATDYSMLPTDQYFVTASADGIWTSSDYYVRLAGAGAQMLKGLIPNTSTIPIPYSLGPVYYRNSFEKRLTTYDLQKTPPLTGYYNIDPCFYKDSVVAKTNVDSASVSLDKDSLNAKTGLFLAKIKGLPKSDVAASYYYKISETKIMVKDNMKISFWKKAVDSLGRYTSIDLLFQSGKRLKNLTGYVDNNNNPVNPSIARGTIGSWEKFTYYIGKEELVGDVITGIIIGYDHPASGSGNFTAYFDNIIIEDGIAPPAITSATTASGIRGTAFSYRITASNSPASYSASGLPDGLSINRSTGFITGKPSTAGTYTVIITATNDGGPTSDTLIITIDLPVSAPYSGTPWTIPGIIQAENFNTGGEGIAYHDNDTTNLGGKYRIGEGVDIQSTNDAQGELYQVTWTNAGEWLEYSVHITLDGSYTLQARVSSPKSGKSFRVEMDGTSIGRISVPNTGDWTIFKTVSVVTPELTAGNHKMRIFMETDGFNINYLNFSSIVTSIVNGEEGKLILYPIPVQSTSTLNIELPETWKESLNVELRNTIGELVYEKTEKLTDTKFVINTEKLPEGVYILQLSNRSNVLTKKIIIH